MPLYGAVGAMWMAMNTVEGRLPWLDDLNPEQRAAVTHEGGPLLVVAGAGTGKTRTLAYRVAYLVATGVDPSRILLLTFTRRAAQEMVARAAAVLARSGLSVGTVWGGTFHSVGHRILRIYGAVAGLSEDFTVLDRGDAEDLMALLVQELELRDADRRFPRKSTCLDIYSRCVNAGDALEDVLVRQFPWCAEWEGELRSLFRHYEERKQGRRVLDLDDLLLYWAELVTDSSVADKIADRFEHILVDEYQDTNRVQARILRGMRRTRPGLTVVGDDAQSIYSFRAAEVRNMLDFPGEFAGTTVLPLERNYRSVQPILATTNLLIAQATQRYTKDLWSARGDGARPVLLTCADEADQDRQVIERVLQHHARGVPLHAQAVLFRAAHLSATLELELGRRGIPFRKYGGLRFLEVAHVKDALAFLRVAENPMDEMAWFRVLQLLERVGPVTVRRAMGHLAEHGHDPSAIASLKAPGGAREGLERLGALLGELRAVPELAPAEQLERVRAFYGPMLGRLYENPEARGRDLESLIWIASGYGRRREFLVDLQLDPPNSTSDLAGPPHKDEDWLVLSTIHSAKGCEWDVVYVIHAADGFLPSDMACGTPEEIEEELRLTYVALTRARDHLHVMWPLRYHTRRAGFRAQHSYAQLCRFFTPPVLATMECVASAPPPEEREHLIDIDEDITARARRRWD